MFAVNQETHDKLSEEATSKGLDLVGYSTRNQSYRRYRFISCGHEADIPTGSVRKNQPKCKTCLHTVSNEVVKQHGLNSTEEKGIYKIVSCGHLITIHTSNLKRGQYECKQCLSEENSRVAELRGLSVIGDSTLGSLYKKYQFNKCGHEVNLQKSNVRCGKVSCHVCRKIKLESEAEKQKISLTNFSVKGRIYRKYVLTCGHSVDLKTEKVRVGLFNCAECGETSWVKPSSTYVFKMSFGEFTWLKVGYSRSAKYRRTRYGLKEGVKTELLFTQVHSSGREAASHEKEIFSSISDWKLPSCEMKEYLTVSGSTECFSIESLPLLDKLFNNGNIQ